MTAATDFWISTAFSVGAFLYWKSELNVLRHKSADALERHLRG